MFGAILHRAQAAVDSAVDGLVNRAIIAVPFIIAGGFATAAVYLRLTREYDAETANLILAAGFVVIGLLCLALFGRSSADLIDDHHEDQDAEDPATTQQTSSASSARVGRDIDRELMMAALTSAAPIALPGLIKFILRNLPLVIAIISALFVLTRSPDEAPSPDPATV